MSTSTSTNTKSRADIYTVAERANVSIATVSRTINGNPTVNAQTAKRVWQVIRELDYFPNTQARALVSGRSGLLGLVVPEITNPFFPELIQGFEDVAVASGYEILLSSTNNDPRRIERCIRRMIERKADAVAIMAFGLEEPSLDLLAKRNVPLVFVDVGPDHPSVTLLKVDYHKGIQQGVKHLAALGHRRIAFIAGPPGLHSAQSRLAAFIHSHDELGIPLDRALMAEADHTIEGGFTAATKLIAVDDPPTAVMCSNDLIAFGMMHKLHRAGLRVPQDISVVGFDDIQLASLMIPPLTSVQLSRTDLARSAVIAMRRHVEGNDPKLEFQIETRLVVRESTSHPPLHLTPQRQSFR